MSGVAPYTEDELRAAVETCSAAPIHVPETIQGFGALLVCDLPLETVLRASANTTEYLGVAPETLIGAHPNTVFTRKELHDLRNRLGHPTIDTQREVLTSRSFGALELQVTAHKRDNTAILEFIPETRPAEERVHLFEQARAFLTVPLDEQDLTTFIHDATDRMRAINGYDRVKFYRFLPDNSGEVIAESRSPALPSYLGMRFPESDIPRIARDLYTKTPFRALHDIHAEDVPVLGGDGTNPVDMSIAALRGLDMVHRQYLVNMEVGSTFSVSVVVDGKLWGLIASHNRDPKPVDPSMLLAAELSGKLISLRIQHAIDTRRQGTKRNCVEIANKFLPVDDSSLAIENYWQKAQADLMALFPSDGLAIKVGNNVSAFGDAPSASALHALFSIAPAQGDTPFTTDSLQTLMPGATWGNTGGAMVLSFGGGGSIKLAFLRNLAETQVIWAGTKEKNVVKGPGGIRLDPRNSFDTYVERTKGRCVEWSATDIDTGRALLAAFQDAFDVQQELVGNRHRLGLMVRELNHRVRNILALVQSISVYSRENATSFAAYTESLEHRIVALAGAHNLLTRADMEGALFGDILDFELGPFSGDGRITTKGPTVAFRPEAVSVVALLIHELTSNAAKYGALSASSGKVQVDWTMTRDGVELTWREQGGPPVKPRRKVGFGLSIIEDAIPYEFKGEGAIEFDPAGVQARFWLPGNTLADASLAVATPAERDDAPTPVDIPQGLTGLVVEDNFIVSKIAQQMLEAEGFARVDRAATIAEAFHFLQDPVYDLCLLDVNLRGEISLPVAKRLEELGIPFIFATGYGSDGHDAVDGFGAPKLTKPVEPEKLRKAIESMSLGDKNG
ncbi:MAG: HWE histidine kinase domain-containing protein [Pseudomonadota bacterium]